MAGILLVSVEVLLQNFMWTMQKASMDDPTNVDVACNSIICPKSVYATSTKTGFLSSMHTNYLAP